MVITMSSAWRKHSVSLVRVHAGALDLDLHLLDLVTQVNAFLPEFLVRIDDLIEHVVNVGTLVPEQPATKRGVPDLCGSDGHAAGHASEVASPADCCQTHTSGERPVSRHTIGCTGSTT